MYLVANILDSTDLDARCPYLIYNNLSANLIID